MEEIIAPINKEILKAELTEDKRLRFTNKSHNEIYVITYQDCLVLYPESVWNEQMNELRSKLNRWNSKHQMIFRQFVSDVEIITLDGNGRFLIPKRYLKLADIRQEVRFIGMDDTIEIWAKEIADKPFIAPEDFGKELEEIMENNNNEGLE